MILAPAKAGLTLYRAYTPRWSFDPFSGAGAASAGGRFNRKGDPALYLAMEMATAVAEYQQTSPFAPPFTMTTFLADLPPLVDVCQLDTGEWDPLWSDWHTPWREMLVNGMVEPPSWLLADLVRAEGVPGVIFPSMTAPGGHNLVLFLDMLSIRDVLTLQDPAGLLPRDDSSWRI